MRHSLSICHIFPFADLYHIFNNLWTCRDQKFDLDKLMNKGVSFQRSCGTASVRKWNTKICISRPSWEIKLANVTKFKSWRFELSPLIRANRLSFIVCSLWRRSNAWNLSFCILYGRQFNPLSPNIHIQILLTVLHIFMLLVGRIWLNINIFHVRWSFPLFSWPVYLIN